MRFLAPLVLTLVLAPLALTNGNDSPVLAQRPTLSAKQIVFSYGGDLWSIPRTGGDARRLTSGPGTETNPVFSPDGSQIAFTGEYDGNVDAFVVGAEGGVPKRLTWHPASDGVLGWTPDGKRVLFASNRTSYTFHAQLFTTDLNGSLPERLPLPMGYEASYSADGSRVAYVPLARAFNAWKRYRGGLATPIWIANLADSAVEKVPREGSNDICPMWIGGKIYFLSDRNGAMTLFSYDLRSKQVKEELKNTGLDYKSASAGPGGIILERFGALELFDLKTSKATPVPVRLDGDLTEVREQRMNVSKRLTNAHLSPTAARAVFAANGEILTVPAEKGDVRNLTETPGVMEREPAWSPDGRTIAYFSDESGEYALHLKPQSGLGEVKKIALEPGFYRGLRWAPDSKKVSFIDARMRIWYLDVESGKAMQVDKENYWTLSNDFAPEWSPDSKWLAYRKRLANYMGAVHLYSLADGKSTQVTDGMSDARSPIFDADGKYLYFLASTDSGPSLQPDVGSFSRPNSASIYFAVLSKEQASPFSPESDEEKVADEKKPDAAKPEPSPPDAAKPAGADAPKPDAAKPARPVNVRIDLENIGQRILAMPMPPRRYGGLQIGKAGVLYAADFPAFAAGAAPGMTIHRYTMSSRRADIAIAGVQTFEVARNGEKTLYRQGDNWYIRNVPPSPPATGATPPTPPPGAGGPPPTPLQTANIEVRHVPREAWKQMYRETWRVQRDYFYDPGFHGLDLTAAEKKYESFLGKIASRADLNYLFAEMMGNMVVGHLNVFGGQTPEVKRVQTGLLGCDFIIDQGRYKFARVFNGENWNPDLRAPLTQPGVNVAAGDYLLAVNGRNLTATDNVYSFFEGSANKQIQLRVGPNANGDGARDATVVPIPSENRLRNLAWIEDNRRKVEQMTGGRVAYVYLPDTAFGGFTNFNRYFYAQVGKQAAIVDERFNGGGALATDIIEQLNRKMLSSVLTRDGGDEVQPQGAIFGPKVMIINEFAGSGGDAMPWYFRRSGAGKLIGKRTWGGLVGRAGAPQLMDGGIVTAPSSAVWDTTESQFIAENIGVAPDIEVELDPAAVRQGRDPQLEKAVETVLKELEKTPPPKLKRPQYPKYKTM